MSFLSPLFLAGALAAAIPILLHLLKRHPEARLKFSAVHLLRNAPVEQSQKRRLRELLLLALRVTALVLLALAFARPFLASSGADASGRAVVVAMDTSLSMAAPGQFERARRLGRDAADREGADAPVAVVAFADTARVAAALSADRALALAAIDSVQPGPGAASYRAALSVAADLLSGRGGTIVVVTDLQKNGWSAADRVLVPASVGVVVADVGAPPPNIAITAARVVGDRVVATVRNTAPESRTVQVTLETGSGEAVSSGGPHGAPATLSVPGAESAEVSFASPQGEWAAVRVEDPEGAGADNVRYVILERAARPKVLVVTAGGDLAREAFYVEQALVAGGATGGAYEVAGVAGSSLQSWDGRRLDEHLAVVLMSTRGLDHHGRGLLAEYLRAGGGVVVGVGADVEGDVLTEALGGITVRVDVSTAREGRSAVPRSLVPSDARHPVLRSFSGPASLGLVRFQRVATVQADECQALARFTTGEPALLDCERGSGRALILASDLDNQWNDFPRRATFLAFVHEALRYVAGVRQSSDYRVGAVPRGVPPVPGIARLAGQAGSAAHLVAVNVDPAESDAQVLTVEQFTSPVTGGADSAVPAAAGTRDREDRQHMWQYVLALMAVVLAIESVVATRTA